MMLLSQDRIRAFVANKLNPHLQHHRTIRLGEYNYAQPGRILLPFAPKIGRLYLAI